MGDDIFPPAAFWASDSPAAEVDESVADIRPWRKVAGDETAHDKRRYSYPTLTVRIHAAKPPGVRCLESFIVL